MPSIWREAPSINILTYRLPKPLQLYRYQLEIHVFAQMPKYYSDQTIINLCMFDNHLLVVFLLFYVIRGAIGPSGCIFGPDLCVALCARIRDCFH